MTKKNKMQALAYLAAVVLSCIPVAASAVGISLVASQTRFNANNLPATMTLQFQLTGVATAADVVRSYDFVLAYDPEVLTFASVAYPGTDPFGAVDGTSIGLGPLPYDYTKGHPNGPDYPTQAPPAWPVDPADLGQYHGTPSHAGTYYEGSLRFLQVTGINTAVSPDTQGALDARYIAELLAKQATNPLLLTLTFNVATDRIANSTIVLLDDRSYLNFTAGSEVFDIKQGLGETIGYFDLPDPITVKVPVPGTLALLGLGLLGVGRMRRR